MLQYIGFGGIAKVDHNTFPGGGFDGSWIQIGRVFFLGGFR